MGTAAPARSAAAARAAAPVWTLQMSALEKLGTAFVALSIVVNLAFMYLAVYYMRLSILFWSRPAKAISNILSAFAKALPKEYAIERYPSGRVIVWHDKTVVDDSEEP